VIATEDSNDWPIKGGAEALKGENVRQGDDGIVGQPTATGSDGSHPVSGESCSAQMMTSPYCPSFKQLMEEISSEEVSLGTDKKAAFLSTVRNTCINLMV